MGRRPRFLTNFISFGRDTPYPSLTMLATAGAPPVTASDLESAFGAALPASCVDKALQLCRLYGVDAEQLLVKWDAYALSKSGKDGDLSVLTPALLDELKRVLQKVCRRGRGRASREGGRDVGPKPSFVLSLNLFSNTTFPHLQPLVLHLKGRRKEHVVAVRSRGKLRVASAAARTTVLHGRYACRLV